MKRTPIVAILIVSLMLIAIVPSSVKAYTPLPVKAPIEPNPALEGNVTFSNHTVSQAPLEYVNQYGKSVNLSAILDPRVPNPILVNPSDIVAPGILQNDTIGSAQWASASSWQSFVAGTGVVSTIGVVNLHGQKAVYITVNSTDASGGTGGYISFNIPASAYPSSNTAFDFVTIMGQVSASAAIASGGFSLQMHGIGTVNPGVGYTPNNMSVANTSVSTSATSLIPAGDSFFFSFPLSKFGQSLPTAGINFVVGIPQSATHSIYNLTVTGFAISEHSLTMGQVAVGKANSLVTEYGAIGQPAMNLTLLSPQFTYSYIAAGGYTTAIEQQASDLPASDVSTSQTPISSVSYVEQVTYSFLLGLPASPSLNYLAFKLTDKVNLAPNQYVSVTYAGISYLSAYSAAGAQGNYTTLISSAAPTTLESWVGTVQYTQAQWNSISSPPGIFTVAGINYLWFVLIGVVAGLVGLGSSWSRRGESASRIRGRGR